jgi:hypothetical protein
MRQAQNVKRGRGRGRRGNNGHNHVPNRNTSYESHGPDVKLRGNAQQLHEKYMALAHDAATAGERITAEAYTQFADHYFRLHQAAVGVAETKRLQDQANNAADHDKDDADKPAADESDEVNAEGSAAEAVADEAVAPVAAPRRQRGAGRGRPANSKVNGSDADETKRAKADTPAGDVLTVDTLTPAQLAEAVQTDQDNKEAS